MCAGELPVGGGKMKNTTVYLAGKMTGLTAEQMLAWRGKATATLEHYGIAVLNPATTKLSDKLTNREIVHSNKFQINNSQLVLAELDNEDVSLGTIGEIVYAGTIGKPVVIWGRVRKLIDYPWIQEHSTIAFETLDEALDYIVANYQIAI